MALWRLLSCSFLPIPADTLECEFVLAMQGANELFRHNRGVLGRTLSSAEDWGYISHNPVLKTKLPRRPIR